MKISVMVGGWYRAKFHFECINCQGFTSTSLRQNNTIAQELSVSTCTCTMVTETLALLSHFTSFTTRSLLLR